MHLLEKRKTNDSKECCEVSIETLILMLKDGFKVLPLWGANASA